MLGAVGKANNKGRAAVRRGRVSRDNGPVDIYINNMFRADEDGLPKDYAAYRQVRADQMSMKLDVRGPMNEMLKEMFEDVRQGARAFADEVQTLNEDLVEHTPIHADGPSDPPKHAFEVWNVDFYPNEKNTFTLTVYNPKDYIPFLEEGWSPQAPAGWIAADWLAFKVRLGDRLKEL